MLLSVFHMNITDTGPVFVKFQQNTEAVTICNCRKPDMTQAKDLSTSSWDALAHLKYQSDEVWSDIRLYEAACILAIEKKKKDNCQDQVYFELQSSIQVIWIADVQGEVCLELQW